jgi:hypothetical protein
MNFINNHYRVAVRNRQTSGCHKEFHCYFGQRPYLLLYYDLINESGGETSTLGNMAFPKLPAAIMRLSLEGKQRGHLTPMKRSASSERKENAGDRLVAVCGLMFCLIYTFASFSNSLLFLLPRQVSIERNELLAEQLACSRAEAKLNIQGKKVALVAQVSDLLRK